MPGCNESLCYAHIVLKQDILFSHSSRCYFSGLADRWRNPIYSHYVMMSSIRRELIIAPSDLPRHRPLEGAERRSDWCLFCSLVRNQFVFRRLAVAMLIGGGCYANGMVRYSFRHQQWGVFVISRVTITVKTDGIITCKIYGLSVCLSVRLSVCLSALRETLTDNGPITLLNGYVCLCFMIRRYDGSGSEHQDSHIHKKAIPPQTYTYINLYSYTDVCVCVCVCVCA